MKTVNIVGGSPIFRGGGHKKKIYIYIYIYGEWPEKGSMDNLQGAWQKIGRRVFLREVDLSMHTMT